MTPAELETLRARFLAGMAQADRNVIIMFAIVLASIAAWYALDLLPVKWQTVAKQIAWAYVFIALALTVLYG